MKPTWTSLAPLLRLDDDGPLRARVGDATCSEAATWSVIERHEDFVLGAVRRVVSSARDLRERYGGRGDDVVLEAFQWVVERLFRRVHRPPHGLPVKARADGTVGSAPKWFFTVCANLARDWCDAERRRMRRERRPSPDRPPPAVDAAPPLWDDGSLRKLRRLLERPDRAGVPDTHVLAYLCLYRPDAVDLALVERAAAYRPSSGSRSGQPGLLREPQETWEHLIAWRERHALAPLASAARYELAWIVRSQDAGDPATWREREPKRARTASVTLGKWAIRCADVLTLPRR